MSRQTETEIATITTDNPYVMMDNQDSDNDTPVVTATVVSTFPSQTRTIYINGLGNTCVEVPIELAEKALQIQSMGRGIKCICYVDLVFNLVYMLYGSVLGFIFSLASASGIYSTYYQSRSLLTCYLCYQYIMVLSKLLTIVFYIALTDSDVRNTFHENYPQIPLPENLVAPIFMSSMLFFIQTYIACYVRKYYNLLPKSGEKKYFVARALPSV
tara:strand:+ start:2283 stop:2924 length:642 start_codon:yes stop_codon:yes gene_type:complete